jgi:Mg-chelatase subunit ChlD
MGLLIIICELTFMSSTLKCATTETKDMSSILLLIDVSGSMKGAKIDSVKSAAKSIINMLLPCNVEFSVMGYSGNEINPVPFHINFTNKQNELFDFIDKLQPNSNTPLGAALKTASFYVKANKNNASIKQTIVLLGDGRSDDNISEALKQIRDKKSLVQCECIGFCIENDKQAEVQLKQIALETKGEYYAATEATNVIHAYIKSSIKTIISDVPVVVREANGSLNFKPVKYANINMLTKQNWIVDSIQINVTSEIYPLAQLLTNENMQDTLPKSIVFDSNKAISLFIKNGTEANVNKKWIEGKYLIDRNAMTINLPNHFIKLIIKKLDSNSLVLCVNKYKSHIDNMLETGEEVCDCENEIESGRPTILVYFSLAGCRN